MNIEITELKKMVKQTFAAAGMNEENAECMAEVMVTAEARGVYSHGVKLIPQYLRYIANDFMKPNPEIRILKETDGILVIDGGSGLGAIVMSKATDLLVEKSRKTGAASLCVVNTGHFGAGAYYVEKAANQGQIAFLYANTPKSAVPFGGTGRYLGTNPYSFSAPAGKYGTITLDMATTETAASKLSAALQEGKEVKLGCGVDADGNPTTDPKAILQGGSLCHFGGVKGYGIAFMIDVVAGVLTGAEYKASELDMFGNSHDKPNVGFFMSLTDIEHLMPLANFTARAEDLIRDIKMVKPAPGFKEVCFPGEIENSNMLRSLRDGVNVHDAAYQNFVEAARHLGLQL